MNIRKLLLPSMAVALVCFGFAPSVSAAVSARPTLTTSVTGDASGFVGLANAGWTAGWDLYQSDIDLPEMACATGENSKVDVVIGIGDASGIVPTLGHFTGIYAQNECVSGVKEGWKAYACHSTLTLTCWQNNERLSDLGVMADDTDFSMTISTVGWATGKWLVSATDYTQDVNESHERDCGECSHAAAFTLVTSRGGQLMQPVTGDKWQPYVAVGGYTSGGSSLEAALVDTSHDSEKETAFKSSTQCSHPGVWHSDTSGFSVSFDNACS